MTKNLLLGIAAVCGSTFQAVACTGISLTSRDGSYVQARTIEWARGVLQSEYVIIPRGQQLTSFTPTGVNGLTFTAKYGVVGLAVVQKEFIAEGINEAGLSAGLFFFPHYGGYETYDAAQNQRTLADLQVTEWLLSQFSTIDEVKAALSSVRVVGLEKPTGGNSGFLGIPGDATPPSRFVRAAFYRGTAPQRATGFDTVQQCFHLLNNFDIPIGIEHSQGDIPDIPSATQWTSAIDLTNRKVYYKTAYNNSIRCIDLKSIDFSKVKYQSQPLDKIQEQPVEMVKIPR